MSRRSNLEKLNSLNNSCDKKTTKDSLNDEGNMNTLQIINKKSKNIFQKHKSNSRSFVINYANLAYPYTKLLRKEDGQSLFKKYLIKNLTFSYDNEEKEIARFKKIVRFHRHKKKTNEKRFSNLITNI